MIALAITFGVANAVALIFAGAQWWHRRHLTDAQFFPELHQHGEPSL